MPHRFINLATILASMLIAWTHVASLRGQSPELPEHTETRELVGGVIEARDKNTAALRTAFGSGKVRFEVFESSEDTSLTVLDADIQVFFDAPKYRIHFVYATKMLERFRQQGESIDAFQKWVPSDIAEQIIIYDGSKIVSVEVDTTGSCEGTIYFGFNKMAVMRNAGFPFENPVTLWSEALTPEGLDIRNLELTPMESGGIVGLLRKNTYIQKFVLFGKFGYDLRRVSSYRIGERQPFRDYLITWDYSNGAHFVRRFSNTLTSANPDTGASHSYYRKLTVEYPRFEANTEIDPNVFELDNLGIPSGTSFVDKRANVEGVPKQLVFDDGRLTEGPAVVQNETPVGAGDSP